MGSRLCSEQPLLRGAQGASLFVSLAQHPWLPGLAVTSSPSLSPTHAPSPGAAAPHPRLFLSL